MNAHTNTEIATNHVLWVEYVDTDGTTTRAEIATNYALWVEYIDTDGTTTKAEFDAMSTEQKLALIEAAFDADQE